MGEAQETWKVPLISRPVGLYSGLGDLAYLVTTSQLYYEPDRDSVSRVVLNSIG